MLNFIKQNVKSNFLLLSAIYNHHKKICKDTNYKIKYISQFYIVMTRKNIVIKLSIKNVLYLKKCLSL